jgi:hypothetical protein
MRAAKLAPGLGRSALGAILLARASFEQSNIDRPWSLAFRLLFDVELDHVTGAGCGIGKGYSRIGVRPYSWTGSRGFDPLPGVVILELRRAQVVQRVQFCRNFHRPTQAFGDFGDCPCQQRIV